MTLLLAHTSAGFPIRIGTSLYSRETGEVVRVHDYNTYKDGLFILAVEHLKWTRKKGKRPTNAITGTELDRGEWRLA